MLELYRCNQARLFCIIHSIYCGRNSVPRPHKFAEGCKTGVSTRERREESIKGPQGRGRFFRAEPAARSKSKTAQPGGHTFAVLGWG